MMKDDMFTVTDIPKRSSSQHWIRMAAVLIENNNVAVFVPCDGSEIARVRNCGVACLARHIPGFKVRTRRDRDKGGLYFWVEAR